MFFFTLHLYKYIPIYNDTSEIFDSQDSSPKKTLIRNKMLHCVTDLHQVFGLVFVQAFLREALSLAVSNRPCNLSPLTTHHSNASIAKK